MKDYIKETLCFGLDIGTRTVVGVVGYKENNELVILGCERRAHEERAMLDGQIHDIQKVAQTVYEVKTALEKKMDVKLTEVAIAAAGRSLSTQIVEVKHHFEEAQEFNLTHIHHLELEGVEKAKAAQQAIANDTDYFCVAYSVINYYLDDYVMANLEGHKGHEISAKILATFLPKQVIDSLYAVTERAELTVSNLTLEPIAAINAIIPENIRLLNLALVDIGAGTSDIAITKDGSVVAYGMIPIAGDEVTETLVHKYLVDFNTAEQIKQQMNDTDEVIFNDILGFEQKVATVDIQNTIKPVISHLTQNISEKIKELNGEHAPNAVFCVGGGSQMHGVVTHVAEHLELAGERVATRSTQHLVKVRDEVGMINSPDMITPIGICMTALQNKYSQFVQVTLNGMPVELLNAKKLTILDAIVASGIEHTDIFPKRGKTLMFKCNEERMRIKGTQGLPAQITLNGKPGTINDHIVEGDHIEVVLAAPGNDGMAQVSDYVTFTKQINLNGEVMALPLARLNGKWLTKSEVIHEGDILEIKDVTTLEDLLTIMEVPINGHVVTVNLDVKPMSYELTGGDTILVDEVSEKTLEVAHEELFESTSDEAHDIHEAEEHKAAHEDNAQIITQVEVPEKANLYIMANGKMIQLPDKGSDYILASIFDFIDFDLTKPQGTIQLIKNGERAGLADVLKNGDTLEIYWKK